jgi:hypothetical protein
VKSLPNSSYAVVAGFVQCEPETREVNGEPVRDIRLRAVGSQKIVRVTVWDKHAGVPLEKGDFIVAEGPWRSWTGQGRNGTPRTYYEVDASTLVRIQASQPKHRVLGGGSPAPVLEAS